MADITEVVIRRWQLRLPEVVRNCKELLVTCERAKVALQEADWATLGSCFCEYWEQKKVMAPGCEPTIVTAMMGKLREKDLIHGVSLGGGGGGGFMIALCKDVDALPQVQAALGELASSWPAEALAKLTYHTVEIDSEGLEVDGKAVFPV